MQLKQARGKTLRACSLHTALKYTKQFRKLCKRQLTNIMYLSLQRLQLPLLQIRKLQTQTAIGSDPDLFQIKPRYSFLIFCQRKQWLTICFNADRRKLQSFLVKPESDLLLFPKPFILRKCRKQYTILFTDAGIAFVNIQKICHRKHDLRTTASFICSIAVLIFSSAVGLAKISPVCI